jgi:hypothetical protein
MTDRITFRLDDETKAILDKKPEKQRSEFIRQALVFFDKYSENFNDITKKLETMEEKLYIMVDLLQNGGASIENNNIGNEKEQTKDEQVLNEYLFSGADEMFG